MCGIAGIVQLSGEHPSDLGHKTPRFWAETLAHAIRHRGPDGNGIADGLSFQAPLPLAFAHLRLSILDLSDAAAQPMCSQNGRFVLTYNGEVYNYLELRSELEQAGVKFKTSSDTEVLLEGFALWGEALLPKLTGMFAFAIVDLLTRRLWLARDPFGIKPLYLSWHPSQKTFAFASEIKALLTLPWIQRKANLERVYRYLDSGQTDDGEYTFFDEIEQVPAGHCIEFALDGSYRFPKAFGSMTLASRPSESSIPEKDRVESVRTQFLENIRLHLRSDVPVGAALSGGLDSSAIVASMRSVGGPKLEIHAFSYIAHSKTLSEERWVDLLTRELGLTLHKIHLTADDLARDLDALIASQDEPFGSTSIYAQKRVFQAAQTQGIKVMLDGQGADELMGGYPAYIPARVYSLVSERRWSEAFLYLRALQRRSGQHAAIAREVARLSLGYFPASFKRHLFHLVGVGESSDWLLSEWFASHGVLASPKRLDWKPVSLRKELEGDLLRSSLPALLRYEDRNSMAHSIESRVPFLTPDFAQKIFNLPEDDLIDVQGTTKAIFRKAMRGIVPDAILDRRDKIGFATPEVEWLRSLEPLLRPALTPETARLFPMIDFKCLRTRWDETLAGKRRFNFRLWRTLNLILWAQKHRVDFT